MTSEELVKAKARDEIILAAIGICSTISEEDIHEMASMITDLKKQYTFVGKMIDLGQAVQDYQS